MTSTMFASGTLVNNRHQVLADVPHGNSLVEAIDRQNNGLNVVLRILSKEELNTEKDIDQFYDDQSSIVDLSHKNIATVYDFGAAGDQFYVASEVVAGVTLGELIAENETEKFDLPFHQTILSQVAEGLRYAISYGVTHGALSPSQILITEEGTVKITGFCLRAKPNLNWCFDEDTQRMLLNQALYDSPEAVYGEDLDQRSDIYSFGLIAYQCVVGEAPFSGKDSFEVGHQQVNTPIPPFADLNNQVPQWYQEMVFICTKKDPKLRYQSFVEVVTLLNSYSLVDEYETTNLTSNSDLTSHTKRTRVHKFILPVALLAAAALALWFGNS